tara:strand:+ start:189 stop:494 length:306 start_codon:yes stop_codon:yes gene_type:complete
MIQKTLIATADGNGTLVELKEGDEGYAHKELTQEEKDSIEALENRAKRNALLEETDWVASRSNETGASVPDAWKTYRQALRDLSTHSRWPNLQDADWPTKP